MGLTQVVIEVGFLSIQSFDFSTIFKNSRGVRVANQSLVVLWTALRFT